MPLPANLIAQPSEREVRSLVERLTRALAESAVAFDRECRLANPLALEAAVERVGANRPLAA